MPAGSRNPGAGIPTSFSALCASGFVILQYRLNFELQIDVLAYQHASRLECCVPVQTPVFTVDGRARLEGNLIVSERIAPGAEVFTLELDLLRDTTHRQLADQREPGAIHILDPCTLEGNGRIFVRIEEIGRAQVRVALFIIRGDRRRLSSAFGFDRREIVRIQAHDAFEVLEGATDLAESEVAHSESESRVRRIDGVGVYLDILSGAVHGIPQSLISVFGSIPFSNLDCRGNLQIALSGVLSNLGQQRDQRFQLFGVEGSKRSLL